jgi:stage III sporulation protein AG
MKEWKDITKILEKLKKKENLFVLILVGMLLMVISFPVDKKEGTIEETTVETQKKETNQVEQLEQRLEQILSKVDGVGEVQVMITLKSEGEKIVEKDTESTENTTNETDSQGGERKTTDYSKKESTVFVENEGGGSEPYVTKEMEPEIEGILVIAQGGDKPSVAQNISEAVLALFPIDAHKIKVMKSVSE